MTATARGESPARDVALLDGSERNRPLSEFLSGARAQAGDHSRAFDPLMDRITHVAALAVSSRPTEL